MTILVTGGAGYIGSHLVHALVDAGLPVVVIDNLSTGFRHMLPAEVPLFVGSVRDRALVEDVILGYKVETVIHFAASTVVSESVVNPLFYYENNTAASLSLIAACVASNVQHFIFSSTAAVYGSAPNRLLKETDLACPVSPYGWSKLMAETILRDTADASGFNYVVLRYFNVAGADPGGRTGQATKAATHLIKVACQVALGIRPELEIYGADYATPDGTCVRDYIHVSDLAKAHLQSLKYLQSGGISRILNCGYGHGYSVREVVEAVGRISRCRLPIVISGRRAGDPEMVVANASEIRSHLEWVPNYDDIDVIISHALAWERRLWDVL